MFPFKHISNTLGPNQWRQYHHPLQRHQGIDPLRSPGGARFQSHVLFFFLSFPFLLFFLFYIKKKVSLVKFSTFSKDIITTIIFFIITFFLLRDNNKRLCQTTLYIHTHTHTNILKSFWGFAPHDISPPELMLPWILF